jgi:hypothetical protein
MPKMNSRNVLFVAVPLAVIVIALLALWRVTDHCETALCQLSSVMPRLAEIQREIEGKPPGAIPARDIPASGEISFGYTAPDGSIVVVAEARKIVVIARPTREAGRVAWSCAAYPTYINAIPLLQDCGKQFREHK